MAMYSSIQFCRGVHTEGWNQTFIVLSLRKNGLSRFMALYKFFCAAVRAEFTTYVQKQDRQSTFNVTLRRVRATVIAVEKQRVLYNLSVCL